MITNNLKDCSPVVKDESNQMPIASVWRKTLCEIVNAFAEGNYTLSQEISGVNPVSPNTAEQIEQYINDYGEVLVSLPEETWSTSVCIWVGSHWDVIVDLWTQESGVSDMILQLQITESDKGYSYEVHSVYVP